MQLKNLLTVALVALSTLQLQAQVEKTKEHILFLINTNGYTPIETSMRKQVYEEEAKRLGLQRYSIKIVGSKDEMFDAINTETPKNKVTKTLDSLTTLVIDVHGNPTYLKTCKEDQKYEGDCYHSIPLDCSHENFRRLQGKVTTTGSIIFMSCATAAGVLTSDSIYIDKKTTIDNIALAAANISGTKIQAFKTTMAISGYENGIQKINTKFLHYNRESQGLYLNNDDRIYKTGLDRQDNSTVVFAIPKHSISAPQQSNATSISNSAIKVTPSTNLPSYNPIMTIFPKSKKSDK